MKKLVPAVVLLAASTMLCRAGLRDKVFLVEITGHDKEKSLEVVTQEEKEALQQEIRLEAKLHTKALRAAEKAWKEDEDSERKSFPRGAVVARRLKIAATFADAEAAAKKLQKHEERAYDKKAKELEREEEKRRTKERAMGREGYRQKLAREKEKEAERAAFHDRARETYAAELKKLIDELRPPPDDDEEPEEEEDADGDEPADEDAPAEDE